MPSVSGQRRLTVVLTADVAQFTRGLNLAQKQLQATSRSMIAVGQQLAFSLGLPLAALGTAAVKLSFDFERSFNQIATLTDFPKDKIEELKQGVIKLADELGADPTQIARAAYAATSAGITDLNQTMEVLENTTKATIIGFGDQFTVTKAVTQIMQAYSKEGVSAARATNAIVLAVQKGNVEAAGMAESVADVLGIAAAMEIEIEAIAAAIGTYTKISGDAAKATTGFRNILADLLKPSAVAVEIWNQLMHTVGQGTAGIEKFRAMVKDDVIGALFDLAKATESNIPAAARLFDNIKGLEALLSDFSSMGEDVVRTYNEIVKETNALDKAWNLMLEDGQRIFGILTGQVKALGTAFGDALKAKVKDALLAMAAFLNVIRPLVAANAELIFQITLAIVGFSAFVVVLGTVGLLISALAKGILVVAGIALRIGGIFAGLGALFSTPFVGLALAVLAVIAVFELLADEQVGLAKIILDSAAVMAGTWVALAAMGVVAAAPWLTAVLAVTSFLAALFTLKAGMDRVQSDLENIKMEAIKTSRGLIGTMAIAHAANMQIAKSSEESAGFFQKAWAFVSKWFQKIVLNMAIFFTENFARRIEVIMLALARANETALGDALIPDSLVSGLSSALDAMSKDLSDWKKQLDDLEAAGVGEGLLGGTGFDEQMAAWKKRWTTAIEIVEKANAAIQEATTGRKFGELSGLDPDAVKKTTDGLARITEMIAKQQDELDQLRHGWTDFQVETLQGVREIAKIGHEAGLSGKQIADLTKLWKKLRVELDQETRAAASMKEISEVIRETRAELIELQAQMTDFEKATAAGLDRLESIDVSTLSDAGRKRLNQAKLDYLDYRLAIQKENKKIRLDIEGTFDSAFDSILRGVLEGTQTWRDVLENFADIGTGIFLDLFKQFIKSKVDFDEFVIPNFLKDIPDAIQTTVDKMQEANEVFGSISDQDLADLIAGAEPAVGELPLPVPVGSDFKGAGTQEVEGVKDGVTGFFDEIGAWFTKGWNKLTGQVEEVELPVVKPPKVEPPEIDIAAMTPDPIYLDPIEVKPPTVDVAPLATVKLAAPKVEVPPLPPVKVPVTAVADPEGTIVVNVPVQIAPPDALMVDVPLVMRPIEEIPVTVPIQVQEPDIQTVHVGIEIPPLEPIVLDLPTVEMAPMDPLRVDVPVVPNPVETLYVDVPVEYKQIHPLFLDIPIEPPKIAPITVDVPVFANPIEPLRVDVPIQPRDVPPIDVPLVLAPIEPLVVEVPILLAPVEPVIPMAPMEEFDRTAASGIGGLAGLTQGVSELNAATVQTSDSIPLVSEGLFSFLDTFDGFGTAIQEAGSAVGSFFTDLFDPEMLKGIRDKVTGWFKGVFDEVYAGIKNFAVEAVGAIGALISAISGLAGGGKGKGSKALKILGIIGQVAGIAASAVGGLAGALSSIGSVLGSIVPPATSVSTQLPGQYTPGPIPSHAAGGIATRPTFGVFGEKGPEALVPLSKMSGMMAAPETTVIVNSPHPASVRKTENPDERKIEVIIDDVIAKSFRTGGKASQSMERSFGMRRTGGTR